MTLQAYYAQRACSYERIYAKPERQAELRALQAWLPGVFAGRHVLEIACGTGWWTPHGARDAASWLATDLNPETLAIARDKSLPRGVRLAELDAWQLHTLGAQRVDAAGDSWQLRALDDGSVHEVLKNFPERDEAVAALGAGARALEWTEHPHYWVLSYTLA